MRNKITTQLSILVFGILVLLYSCKTVQTESGEKVKAFQGTIVYDVKVEQKADTAFEKSKKGMFGEEMYLTVFKNGDLQRRYSGTSPNGYDLQYLDVEKNEVVQKYNNSDSLYVHAATTQNIQKVSDLRTDKDAQTVLNYNVKQVAITAQETPSAVSSGQFLTIKYWYPPELKIDKSLYSSVNEDLWSYFMNKSDGSIYLKYEIDYFTYKVTYTAKQILPGKFERSKEKISDEVPRVQD